MRKNLQEYERKGNVGIFSYGEDDADEKTYTKRFVIYRKPVVRSRAEYMAEQKRMLQLGVYEDESSAVPVRNAVSN